MSNNEQPILVNVYIDGFNLYHAINDLNQPHLKWLDLMALAKSFLRQGEQLGCVHYFTAVVHWDSEKRGRHKQYIRALKQRGVNVVEGSFRNTPKRCPKHKIICPHNEEKQTDVSIGITMLSEALTGQAARQVLITADSDQIPTVKAIKSLAPDVELTLGAPPGRMQSARELGNEFTSKSRKEISAGRIQAATLPREVKGSDGALIAVRPKDYDPPE